MTWKQRVKGRLIGAYLNPKTQEAARRVKSLVRPDGEIELFFQACDPHSYLLAQLMPALQERTGVAVRVTPVPPPAADAEPEPERRRAFAVQDCKDLARYYELDFPTSATLADPARAQRASAILLAAGADRPTAAIELGAAVWNEDDAALDAAANRYGASPRVEAELRDAYARMRKRGHYQGAMIELGGEWMWGVDRIGYVEQRLGAPPDESVLAKRPESAWPDTSPTSDDPPVLELFHSFRSPYSYLSLARTFALAQRYPIELQVKPVLPMVMRGLEVPLVKRLYIVKDAKREADRLGIAFGRICDPVGVGAERCMAVFRLAADLGRATQFCLSAGRGIWAEALDVADDADFKMIVERAEIPWPEAEAAMHDEGWRDMADANRAELLEAGLWGVPSFRFGTYTTWGQDRIWMLEHQIQLACQT